MCRSGSYILSYQKNVLAARTYDVVSKLFRTDHYLTIRPIGRHHPRSSSIPHVGRSPSSPPILERFLEVLFCQSVKHSAIRPGCPQCYQTGVLSASISFLKIGRSHRVPNQGSTVSGGWQPFRVSPETAGHTRCSFPWSIVKIATDSK
jgi:hypothetical protein